MSFLSSGYGCTILLGPFVDDTDGKTAETGLAESMTVYLSKCGGAAAARASVGAIAHDRNGYYLVPLAEEDVQSSTGNPVPDLVVFASPSGALPVKQHYTTVDPTFYSALYNDLGIPANLVAINDEPAPVTNLEAALDGTGYAFANCEMPADVIKISGDATAADNAEAMFDGTGFDASDSTIGADIAAIGGSTSAKTNLQSAFNGTGYDFSGCLVPGNMVQLSGSTTAADRLETTALLAQTGTVSAGTITASSFPTSLSSAYMVDDWCIGRWIFFTDGDLQGQAQKITDFVTSTNTVIVAGFTTTPTVGDGFVIL